MRDRCALEKGLAAVVLHKKCEDVPEQRPSVPSSEVVSTIGMLASNARSNDASLPVLSFKAEFGRMDASCLTAVSWIPNVT